MEEYEYFLLYKMSAIDELDRHFETIAKIDANYLVLRPHADHVYLDMLNVMASNILMRMGTEVKAEWTVEVSELGPPTLREINEARL